MTRKRIATLAIEALENEMKHLVELDSIVYRLDCKITHDSFILKPNYSDIYSAARNLVEAYYKQVEQLNAEIDAVNMWSDNKPNVSP